MTALLLVQVCERCSDPEQIKALRAALQTIPGIRFAPIICTERCDAPSHIWLQREGSAIYAFSGIDLASDLADIVATVRTYLDHPRGWIEDARPCGRLRHCLSARIPA